MMHILILERIIIAVSKNTCISISIWRGGRILGAHGNL